MDPLLPTDPVSALNQVLSILKNVDPSERERILDATSTFFGIQLKQHALLGVVPHRPGPAVSGSSFSDVGSPTPKEFLLQKQPQSEVERVACLAYYLTHYRDMPHFRTIDLSKLNTEAAQPRLSNANYATRNALTYGYLAQASKGQRQLSAAGEQFVNALPDRVAAKMVMANLMKRKRQKKRPNIRAPKKGGVKKGG